MLEIRMGSTPISFWIQANLRLYATYTNRSCFFHDMGSTWPFSIHDMDLCIMVLWRWSNSHYTSTCRLSLRSSTRSQNKCIVVCWVCSCFSNWSYVEQYCRANAWMGSDLLDSWWDVSISIGFDVLLQFREDNFHSIWQLETTLRKET